MYIYAVFSMCWIARVHFVSMLTLHQLDFYFIYVEKFGSNSKMQRGITHIANEFSASW